MTSSIQLALKEALKGSPLEERINRSIKHREKLFRTKNKEKFRVTRRSDMFKMALRLAETQRYRGRSLEEIWEIVQNEYLEYHN